MNGGFQNSGDILGLRVDFVDYRTTWEIIEKWRAQNEHHFILVAAPKDVEYCRAEDVRRVSAKAGLVLPDGVGIVIAATLLGYEHYGRVTGAELMLKLCDWGRLRGYRHFFYGDTETVLDRLVERLPMMYPGVEIAGTYSPPFRSLTPDEDDTIIREINSTHPDIVWVGLGAPKQQIWMEDHLNRIAAPVMIGVGAVFKFHSGAVKWAPAWVRRSGLEWIYRAVREPRRMFSKTRRPLVFGVRVIWHAARRHWLNH